MKALTCLLAALLVTTSSYSKLSAIHKERESRDAENEVLYLPSGKGLHVLSFGYKNFLSDVLWFKTISYFGKHFKGDKDYTWLAHMCELVTDLNPRAEHVFDFCGTMLAWEAEKPEKSIEILTKAIHADPKRWRPYYLRGFTAMYFLNDDTLAQQDFLTASKIPDAPLFLARLAAKKISLSDPRSALAFLGETIKRAKDPLERSALIARYKEIERKIAKNDARVRDK